MEIKQQSNEKVTTNTKSKNKNKKNNKPMNILRHSKNCIYKTMEVCFTMLKATNFANQTTYPN